MRKRQRDDVASGGKRLPPRLRPRYSWVETVGVELLESMDSSMSTTVPQPDEFEFPAPSGPWLLNTMPPTMKRRPRVAEKLTCDLEHGKPVPATVRLEIKSTRAGKPGHPMIRVVAVCASHARQLRELGLELVRA